MSQRWMIGEEERLGRVASRAAAASGPNLTTPSIPTYCASLSGSVVRSGLSRITSAKKNSFQAVMNAKSVVTTIPGMSSGAMIPVRIWNRVAPSTVAASSRSRGIPRTYV